MKIIFAFLSSFQPKWERLIISSTLFFVISFIHSWMSKMNNLLECIWMRVINVHFRIQKFAIHVKCKTICIMILILLFMFADLFYDPIYIPPLDLINLRYSKFYPKRSMNLYHKEYLIVGEVLVVKIWF